ncbi:thioredoxin [Entophlyctis helioformis]|nr:thioredoxin [Entophlyctis helioformis]
MTVISITSADEFASVIAGNKVVIVDFFATWCGPCKVISPKFHQFSKEYDAFFIQVDVDEVPDVAQKCNIRAMPTFQIFENGTMTKEVVGADPRKLLEAITGTPGVNAIAQ